jgi:hypothetical protein
MNREELIALVKRITELRDEVAKLNGLQKELKRLEAQLDSISGVVPVVVTTKSGVSIEERVAKFLQDHPFTDWDAETVSAELNTKVPTTRAAFSKLRKAGRIKDTKRGHVQAKGNEPVEESKSENEKALKVA